MINDPSECLSIPSALVAWYDGSSVDIETQRWNDKTGNGYDGYIFDGTGRIDVLIETNATNELYLNNEPVAYGNSTQIEFGFASTRYMSPNHTIFNLCKYRDGVWGDGWLRSSIVTNSVYYGYYGHVDTAWLGYAGM